MCHYCPYADCPRKRELAKEGYDAYQVIPLEEYEIEIRVKRRRK